MGVPAWRFPIQFEGAGLTLIPEFNFAELSRSTLSFTLNSLAPDAKHKQPMTVDSLLIDLLS